MTSRNEQTIARLETQARAIRDRLEVAILEFPGLCRWAVEYPVRYSGCTQREHLAALRRYVDRAVPVAASRVSEAYGLGRGSEWAARHQLHAPAADARAAGQALASLARVA